MFQSTCTYCTLSFPGLLAFYRYQEEADKTNPHVMSVMPSIFFLFYVKLYSALDTTFAFQTPGFLFGLYYVLSHNLLFDLRTYLLLRQGSSMV
jgi:hypothetical protein